MTHPLTKAFQALRKIDYLAERKYACCRSCANAQTPDDKQSLCVYTTDQDENDLKRDNSCYLSWSAPDDNPKEIIKALKAQGIKVSWNKSPRVRLKITL